MSVDVDHRPTRPGGVLAVLAGTAAVAFVAGTRAQLLPLAVELVGLLVFAAGMALIRRARVPGAVLAFAGGSVVFASLAFGASSPARFSEQVELLPGMLGVALLAAGVVQVRDGWSRRLVMAGAAALVVGVLTSGVVHGATKLPLLTATALAVLAWDTGEQAITLGEQVGRGAETLPVELAHGGATALVGGLGVLLASTVYDFGITGIPLVGLALLLGAVLVLAIALDL